MAESIAASVGAYVELEYSPSAKATSVGAYVELVQASEKKGNKGKPPKPPKPKPGPKPRYKALFADLIAWWPAGASSGSKMLFDLVGNNNAPMQGIVPWLDLDAWGYAADMPGSAANYFNAGNNRVLCSSDLCIAAWVRFDAVPTENDTYQWIIARDASGQRSCALGIKCSVSGHEAQVCWIVGSTEVFSSLGTSILPGHAYHIVVAGAGGKAPGTWALYIDGILQGVSGYSGGVPTTTNETYLGMREYAANEQPMDGQIIDIQAYGRALTPPEVAYLYDPRSRWVLYDDEAFLAQEAPPASGGGGPMALTGLSGLSALMGQ